MGEHRSTSDRTGGPEAFDPFELTDSVQGSTRDPYPRLAELRRQAPVHPGPMPILEGSARPDPALERPVRGNVTVYGYDETAEVLRDNRRFSSSVYADVIGIAMGRTLLEMDEPEHRLHRSLVSPAFRQRVLVRWEHELVRAVVEDLVDGFAGDGRADLVRQLMFAFPVQVIARILGLPREDLGRFQRWSIELLSMVSNWERGMAASASLREYFAGVVDQRRSRPADDLVSDLVAVEIEGERLSDEEIFSFLALLLPAGVETTYRATGNLMAALFTHPEAMAAVRRDPGLRRQAIEESLRWEPPITFLVRKAVEDVTLAGVEIAPGDNVGVCIAAANRDERRYPDPDLFDIERGSASHLTFGSGPHVCLGMHLARMEARVALDVLLERLVDLALDPEGERPSVVGMAFRSPDALPVVFSAA